MSQLEEISADPTNRVSLGHEPECILSQFSILQKDTFSVGQETSLVGQETPSVGSNFCFSIVIAFIVPVRVRVRQEISEKVIYMYMCMYTHTFIYADEQMDPKLILPDSCIWSISSTS